MPDDTNDHFFACDLLRSRLFISIGRSELLQAGELAERIEGYDARLKELGAWLMGERVRAAPAYPIHGQKTWISSIDPAEIEVTRWLRTFEELAASVAPTYESRAYCVYVAECSWVVAILRAFVDFERSLSSGDVSARYWAIEDEIRDVIAWIEAQRDEIAAERIQADTLRALQDRTAPVIDAAARAWPDDVRAHSARYPHPLSLVHRA